MQQDKPNFGVYALIPSTYVGGFNTNYGPRRPLPFGVHTKPVSVVEERANCDLIQLAPIRIDIGVSIGVS